VQVRSPVLLQHRQVIWSVCW
ncbi:helix-turn-helix family protein, partial [Vibrio parahaemolyticus VPTS-2010_2]